MPNGSIHDLRSVNKRYYPSSQGYNNMWHTFHMRAPKTLAKMLKVFACGKCLVPISSQDTVITSFLADLV